MKRDYLLAIDLDGTLIKNFDEYDKVSFKLLKKLSKTNKIIIATGRPWRSSKFYYQLLDLSTPIINYNGALVHHPKDPSFKKTMITVDRQILIDLTRDLKEVLINVFCEIEDEIFLWKDTAEIKPYLHTEGGNLFTGEMNKILYSNPNGIIALSVKGSEIILQKYLKEKYGDRLNLRFWDANNFVISEIYSPLTSKGNALKNIASLYNIPKEKIIAIGDGHNDLEMCEFASIGVAMENAHPELIEIADYITSSLDENGVYHFLKDFFKISDQ